MQSYSKPLVTLASTTAGQTAPDGGFLAFGSISGTTASTANAVVTTTAERSVLDITNSTDVDIKLVVGGVDTNLILKAGASRLFDLQSALRRIDGGTVIGVYRRSTGPASGEVVIQLI